MIALDTCADLWFRWMFAASWQLTLIVLNFQSQSGIPLEPVVYEIETK